MNYVERTDHIGQNTYPQDFVLADRDGSFTQIVLTGPQNSAYLRMQLFAVARSVHVSGSGPSRADVLVDVITGLRSNATTLGLSKKDIELFMNMVYANNPALRTNREFQKQISQDTKHNAEPRPRSQTRDPFDLLDTFQPAPR